MPGNPDTVLEWQACMHFFDKDLEASDRMISVHVSVARERASAHEPPRCHRALSARCRRGRRRALSDRTAISVRLRSGHQRHCRAFRAQEVHTLVGAAVAPRLGLRSSWQLPLLLPCLHLATVQARGCCLRQRRPSLLRHSTCVTCTGITICLTMGVNTVLIV